MSVDELFDEATTKLGLDGQLPTLEVNALESLETLNQAQEWLEEKVPPNTTDEIDVLILGSYARLEASGVSDFDYLIVMHSLPSDIQLGRQLLRAADDFIQERLDTSGESRRPGRTGLFGQITAAADLTERIGLEQDTNLSHTRRLLILEESRSIYRPDLHRKLVHAVCERYLVDYDDPKPGPPRFLLNDVIRYWYTIAVDYQAKRWQGSDDGWGLRYLKLINSRKIAYAGTLASLLRCSEEQPASVEYLETEFLKTPITRLAQLALDVEFNQLDALRQCLVHAERFAHFLADGDLRAKIKRIRSPEEARGVAEFVEMRNASDGLQIALEQVFFESNLVEAARHYLAF